MHVRTVRWLNQKGTEPKPEPCLTLLLLLLPLPLCAQTQMVEMLLRRIVAKAQAKQS